MNSAYPGHQSQSRIRRPCLTGLVLAPLIALSGCPAGIDRPDRIVDPDAIGIIDDVHSSEDGTSRILHLDSGAEVTIVTARDIEVTGNANEGFLLVSGTVDDARWSMFLRSGPETGVQPEDCFVAGVQPFDDGDSVIFPAAGDGGAFGIRLKKADEFRAEPPNPRTGRWGTFDGPFCLNEAGEVIGQAEALRRESE